MYVFKFPVIFFHTFCFFIFYCSEAEDEPIIAEPNIVGGIPIDSKCKFLLLMSDGFYKSLEEATGTSNVIIFKLTFSTK